MAVAWRMAWRPCGTACDLDACSHELAGANANAPAAAESKMGTESRRAMANCGFGWRSMASRPQLPPPLLLYCAVSDF